MNVPAVGKVSALSDGESSMIEDELGCGLILEQRKFHDRIIVGLPAGRAPGLYQAFILQKLQIAARDIAAE